MEELFRVYHLLADNPRYGISRAKFLQALGIDSRRQQGALSSSKEQEFERAKKALRDAGIPLVSTDGGGYRLKYTGNPLAGWKLSPEDYGVLDTLCKSWYGTQLEGSARRILRKVALSVPSLGDIQKLGCFTEPLTRIRFADGPYLAEIFEALSEHKNVSITYSNYNSRKSRSTLSVWGVGYRYGNWYFTGTDITKPPPLGSEHAGFTYRFSRIASLTTLTTAQKSFVDAPECFSMAAALKYLNQWQNSTLEVEDAHTGERFSVPSYGTVETAIESISHSWRIPSTVQAHEDEHRCSVRVQQQQILRDLHTAHTQQVRVPQHWKKNTTRDRPDAVDRLIDALLGLHYAQITGQQNLRKMGLALGVDTGKPKKLLDIFRALETHYDSHVADDSLPFERGFDDLETGHKGTHLLEYLPLGQDHLLYAGVPLSETELALLVFSLDAARHVLGQHRSLLALREALAASYGERVTQLEQALSFYPDAPHWGAVSEALRCGLALRIRYGDQVDERTIDPYGLVFMRNQFYLYSFCRRAAQRVGEQNAWRSFRLSSIVHLEEAGGTVRRQPPQDAHTPEEWSRSQQVNENNPYVLLRVCVEAFSSPGSSAVKEACRHMLNISSHTAALDPAKPNSPKVFHQVHYFSDTQGQGERGILERVIENCGRIELLEPQWLRDKLLERIEMLLDEEERVG